MAIALNQQKKRDKRVAIVGSRDGIKQAIRESLEKIGGMHRFVKKGEVIFVKPNLTGDRPPSSGAVTNPEVLKALVELIYEQGPEKVLLGDSPSWGFDAEKTYDVTGVRSVAAETGCTLVNLDEDRIVECEIPGAKRLKKVKIAKTILECDKIINVPVLKTHMQCIVSLGLKNMKGVLPLRWKTKLHNLRPFRNYSGLDVGISDLHRLIQPDLTVVDGTIGMEGRGPFDGEPVKMDLIISGEDPVLVDAVSALIMGFSPEQIPAIKLSAENDGVVLDDYEIVGLSVDSVKRPFKPCPTDIYEGDNVQVVLGAVCTGCLATLNTAIHRLAKRNEMEEVEDLLIAIGKDPPVASKVEKVLIVGNCALKAKIPQGVKRIRRVEGCPPTGWQIVEGIRKLK